MTKILRWFEVHVLTIVLLLLIVINLITMGQLYSLECRIEQRLDYLVSQLDDGEVVLHLFKKRF